MKFAAGLMGLAVATGLSTAALADDRVLVVPFSTLNVPAPQQWIAKGVQENLIADLGRTGGLNPIALNTQVIVEDNATAARLARVANAPLAIRGSAQMVGDNIRLTAQLIDARSGDTIRTALVTGSTGDLLKLEDDLANQIRGTAAAATPSGGAGAAAGAVPIIIQQPQPQVIVVSQPQPVYYPSYPSYSYPYAFNYGYPVILYQVPTGNHGHDRDHDHDGHNPGGGGFNPTSLPIPNNNILPIPTNNVLPVPTNNVVPVMTHQVPPNPTHRVAPIPAVAPAAPRTNAGSTRIPKRVN